MKRSMRAGAVLLLGVLAFPTLDSAAAESSLEVVKIWPGTPPGTEDWSGVETAADTPVPDAGRVVHLIRNVTVPTLTIVRPAARKASGAGMVVLPGGAFGALAWDLEGMEVARWLAARGITAFVLKYRVHDADAEMAAKIQELFSKPPTENRFEEAMKVLDPRREIAAEDAKQAVRVVRSDAQKYGVAPHLIGMMGFSAGAITTMSAVLESEADARPNFAAPIYGAAPSNLTPPRDAPPLFIAVAADDPTVPPRKSIEIFESWRSAGLTAELHIYESGGHGFGLGKPNTASLGWTAAFEAWLGRRGLLRARE